jgi:hypothetical protein
MHPYCGTAAIYAKGKGAHGIHVTQGPRFVPGSTKVILKVLAAGINPVDYKIPEIKGYRGGAGLDVCGEVNKCTCHDFVVLIHHILAIITILRYVSKHGYRWSTPPLDVILKSEISSLVSPNLEVSPSIANANPGK